jgi:hypothetical protein
MVSIEKETPWEPSYSNYGLPPLPPEITFTVGPVAGYVMTLRNPADLMKPAGELEDARKEIEP